MNIPVRSPALKKSAIVAPLKEFLIISIAGARNSATFFPNETIASIASFVLSEKVLYFSLTAVNALSSLPFKLLAVALVSESPSTNASATSTTISLTCVSLPKILSRIPSTCSKLPTLIPVIFSIK